MPIEAASQSQWFDLVTSIAPVVLAAVALFSLLTVQRALRFSNYMALMNSTLSHNKSITESKINRVVIDQTHGLARNNPRLLEQLKRIETETPDSYAELYWATRAVHLSHMNLLAKAWRISNEDPYKFETDETGWALLARLVYRDIYSVNPDFADYPDWYQDACRDIDPREKDAATFTPKWERYTLELVHRSVADIKARMARRSTLTGRIRLLVGKAIGTTPYSH